MVYSMEEIDAPSALQLGLVSTVVPLAGLDGALDKLLAAMTARSPEALIAVKDYFRVAPYMEPRGAADYAANLLAARAVVGRKVNRPSWLTADSGYEARRSGGFRSASIASRASPMPASRCRTTAASTSISCCSSCGSPPRRKRHPGAAAQAVCAQAGAWRDDVVVPLRALRRKLKDGSSLVERSTAELFRTRIKAVELESERLQQEALFALAAGLRRPSARRPSRPRRAPTCAAYEHAMARALHAGRRRNPARGRSPARHSARRNRLMQSPVHRGYADLHEHLDRLDRAGLLLSHRCAGEQGHRDASAGALAVPRRHRRAGPQGVPVHQHRRLHAGGATTSRWWSGRSRRTPRSTASA